MSSFGVHEIYDARCTKNMKIMNLKECLALAINVPTCVLCQLTQPRYLGAAVIDRRGRHTMITGVLLSKNTSDSHLIDNSN